MTMEDDKAGRYVLPGDFLGSGEYKSWANAIKIGDKFYATRVGVLEMGEDRIRVIPMSGPYIPKLGDVVIGKVIEVMPVAWTLDINSFFNAFLPAQHAFRSFDPERDELSNKFKLGDLILASIAKVERGRDSMLSLDGEGLGKIEEGEVFRISQVKVPRLIGKKGSMVQKIEELTGAQIFVGQNGIIVAKGPPESITKVKRAIEIVETMAHMSGLTDKMGDLLR
ncbi:MAG: RNA-binding protein [Nitrososphaerota archaeon]|nr:RNA-binding protein [Nitrososphaerota archaeon]MDG7045392.1 RNA-binding protein [Nitrososphaerota archaeon]